jgi:antitoxin (DNA-binding transcriptional repressor) of toxin-antitoxin stability system
MTPREIRDLKANLSRYLRRVEVGECIALRADGRIVAYLVPAEPPGKQAEGRFDELVATGVIRPPLEAGDPTQGWPEIGLPTGTAAELINADRGPRPRELRRARRRR